MIYVIKVTVYIYSKYRKQTGGCQRGVGRRMRGTGEREIRGISFQLQNKCHGYEINSVEIEIAIIYLCIVTDCI